MQIHTMTDDETFRKLVGKLCADLRGWRRMVARQVRKQRLSARTQDQYLILHGRILNTCRTLLERAPVEDVRRETVLQIERMVRPWRTTEVLKDAPRAVVADVLSQGESFEMELTGKRRRAGKNMHKIALAATAAAVFGIVAVVLLDWSADPWGNLDYFTYAVAQRIRRSSFTEQFAVAVFLSWIAGTWMISAVYKS